MVADSVCGLGADVAGASQGLRGGRCRHWGQCRVRGRRRRRRRRRGVRRRLRRRSSRRVTGADGNAACVDARGELACVGGGWAQAESRALDLMIERESNEIRQLTTSDTAAAARVPVDAVLSVFPDSTVLAVRAPLGTVLEVPGAFVWRWRVVWLHAAPLSVVYWVCMRGFMAHGGADPYMGLEFTSQKRFQIHVCRRRAVSCAARERGRDCCA